MPEELGWKLQVQVAGGPFVVDQGTIRPDEYKKQNVKVRAHDPTKVVDLVDPVFEEAVEREDGIIVDADGNPIVADAEGKAFKNAAGDPIEGAFVHQDGKLVDADGNPIKDADGNEITGASVGKDGELKVTINTTGAELLLIKASQYVDKDVKSKALQYDIDDAGAKKDLVAPLLLIGKAIQLLGDPVQKITFYNPIATEIVLDIIVAGDATPSP